jgi:hypothetical protein
LSCIQSDLLTLNNRLGLLDYLLSFGENQFDMARVGHVWVDLEKGLEQKGCWVLWRAYTTVSTVCSAALLGCLVDLDVLNNQVASIETLGICVCLCILEKTWYRLEFWRKTKNSGFGHTE